MGVSHARARLPGPKPEVLLRDRGVLADLLACLRYARRKNDSGETRLGCIIRVGKVVRQRVAP